MEIVVKRLLYLLFMLEAVDQVPDEIYTDQVVNDVMLGLIRDIDVEEAKVELAEVVDMIKAGVR